MTIDTARKAYIKAGKAYNKEAYDEAMAQAWKAYKIAYKEAMAQAWKAYDEAKAQAEKAYYEDSSTLIIE